MQGESIYSLIPQPVVVPQRPERYASQHPPNAPPTFSTFGLSGTSKPGYQNLVGSVMAMAEGHHAYVKPHATMGKEGNARQPAEVLKKQTGGGGGAADARNASGGALPLHLWPAPGRAARRGGRATTAGGRFGPPALAAAVGARARAPPLPL